MLLVPTHLPAMLVPGPYFCICWSNLRLPAIESLCLRLFLGPQKHTQEAGSAREFTTLQGSPQLVTGQSWWINSSATSFLSWKNLEYYSFPTFIRVTPLHLHPFVNSLWMHHLLASFSSLSQFSTPQPVLPGITSQINYFYLNLFLKLAFSRNSTLDSTPHRKNSIYQGMGK